MSVIRGEHVGDNLYLYIVFIQRNEIAQVWSNQYLHVWNIHNEEDIYLNLLL